MRELEVFEAGIHKCGYHVSLLDPNGPHLFTPDAWVCPVCQGHARESRRLHRLDELQRDKNDPLAPSPADGRDLRMRMLTPAEAEKYRQSVAEKAPGKKAKAADQADRGQ